METSSSSNPELLSVQNESVWVTSLSGRSDFDVFNIAEKLGVNPIHMFKIEKRKDLGSLYYQRLSRIVPINQQSTFFKFDRTLELGMITGRAENVLNDGNNEIVAFPKSFSPNNQGGLNTISDGTLIGFQEINDYLSSFPLHFRELKAKETATTKDQKFVQSVLTPNKDRIVFVFVK